MTIYFCFRSIYLDNKLKSGTDIKHETSVPDTVYKNLDEFKKLHPALENLTPEEMLKGNTAPFHPGAVRYYKEKGLMR